MDNDKKGFWAKTVAWLNAEDVAPEIREGSVGSAGGSSPLANVLPPSRNNVSDVTVDAALSISSVYRAVDILCTSVQQLELRVERSGVALKTVPALVAKPDINSNASKFLKKTTMSLATHGNAYWFVSRSDSTAPVNNLQVLNPQAIIIDYDKSGNKQYHYTEGAKTVTYKDWQVKHLKLMEPFGSDYGLGPIQAARGELRGNLDVRDYASNWFSNGAVPTGVLTTQFDIDAETSAEMRRRWEENQVNRGVAVVGKGLTYQPIVLSPSDVQFLETQNFSITQVARLFGIPANYLLADAGNSQTYQNMIQVDTAFIRYTLTGYLREIEEAFSDLLPRGQVARFNVEGFLRADDKTRAEVDTLRLAQRVVTPEEVRIKEGWGPLPDDLKVQAPTPNNNNEGNVNA